MSRPSVIGARIVAEKAKPLAPEVVASIDRMSDILANSLTDSEKRRLEPIYDYLKANDVIDAGIAMQVAGKSSSTVNRFLQRLVGLSVLAPVGAARSTAYRRIKAILGNRVFDGARSSWPNLRFGMTLLSFLPVLGRYQGL